jgi:hypothetical protein
MINTNSAILSLIKQCSSILSCGKFSDLVTMKNPVLRVYSKLKLIH